MSGHHHDSEDDHDHAQGHAHGHSASRSRLGWVALLTGVFLLVELVGGVLSGSLALLADAGHMFTDFVALVMAYVAARLGDRPPDARHTYGLGRVGVLVAFVNGLSLFLIAGFIVWEAAERLMAPPEVLAAPMLMVAIAGLVVNLLGLWLLGGHGHANLNTRAAALHILGDLLGSVAAILAALIILWTGFLPIDPLLSVLVALIILRSAWRVVGESGRILLETAPQSADGSAIADDLMTNVPGLASLHHLHVWALTEEQPMLTLHARAKDPASPPEALSAAIKARLKGRWHIGHATIEVERDRCADGDEPQHGEAAAPQRVTAH